MSLNRTIAHFVTYRRRALTVGVVALVLACVLIIVWRARIASDVLDLLPQHFDSVQTFKIYDREFSQARELTFAILDETGTVDLDGFTEHFGDSARAEPWVVRVMDRSPMESTHGIQEAQGISLPLLLNLPPDEFAEAVQALKPDAIGARLARLRAELEAGSPKAEFQLGFDPLGVVGPALKPLAGSFAVEETKPLASPDGTLRVVMVITNQTDLGAHACQATMRRVEDFNARALAAWDGPKPQILVTGRTPYVAELSLKMRSDVVWTMLSSALLVSVVFWLGFRRFRPLFALMHVLLLCCLVAVAMGALIFRDLNMITIGLCAILIGLGVDFGMMLYGIYQAERDAGHDHETAIAVSLEHHRSGVIFGALTTAAAFLSLLHSDCTGFEQLGVLIAFGILFAGLFMMTIFFVFIGKKHRPRNGDVFRYAGERFVGLALARPRALFFSGGALLVLLTAFAAAPIGQLSFDANPRSLEPRDSDAGHALRTIQAKMPSVGEPLIVLLETKDAQSFHDQWNRLQQKWAQLVSQGRLRSANTPAAFALSPERIAANAEHIRGHDLTAAKATLAAEIERQEMNRESFAPAFAMLNALSGVAAGDQEPLRWRTNLPQSSSWWFVLDHFFGSSPNLGVGYITPQTKLTSFEEKETLRQLLEVPGIDMHISGWTYTLADLVPWAKGKLVELTLLMIGFNILLLMFLYRRFFPLLIMLTGLALAIGALLASLKLLGVSLNLFNVLAFPLVLGVGVDYGIYIVIAMRAPGPMQRSLSTVIKPVLLSGLTTAAAFGSLITATNPALRGLGIVCALGVAWCLFSTLFFVLPAYAWRGAK